MKRSTRVALAACAAVLCVSPVAASHSWGSYHWARTGNPVALTINTALTGSWPQYVGPAVSQWDQSNVLALSGPNPVNAGTKKCNPIPGQILVCNALYGQRGWLGIASIWANGDHITQGTTKLNDTYFNTARYNTPAWRAMVACQEIGHDFGLGHVNETFTDPNTGSCMDYSNDPSGTAGTNGTNANIAPDQHDFDQLATMYGHGDSTTTATASTNFGIRQVGRAAPQPVPGEGVGDTMADWGTPVHRDGKGRPDVFVKSLGGGHKVITHVFWALEAKGTEAR